jgi:hypothetical protein
VATLFPAKGADHATVLGCTDEGTVVASVAGGGIVMIDGTTRETAHRGEWPIAPGPMRRGADGNLYFLSGERFWRWTPAQNEIAPVATPGACTMLTEPSPGVWLLADATSVYRVRLADNR